MNDWSLILAILFQAGGLAVILKFAVWLRRGLWAWLLALSIIPTIVVLVATFVNHASGGEHFVPVIHFSESGLASAMTAVLQFAALIIFACDYMGQAVKLSKIKKKWESAARDRGLHKTEGGGI